MDDMTKNDQNVLRSQNEEAGDSACKVPKCGVKDACIFRGPWG
jgi:hypothetical protein